MTKMDGVEISRPLVIPPAEPVPVETARAQGARRRAIHASERVVAVPQGDFRVEGVYVEEGIRVVIYGEVTFLCLARLETVLRGLLQLRPDRLVVEFDTALDDEVSLELARLDLDDTQFLVRRAGESSVPLCGTGGSSFE